MAQLKIHAVMVIPFVYGRLAETDDFTGREQDIIRLDQNLRGGINTVIMSPRRWGKSSLVHRVLKDIMQTSDDYITCHIDVFNCRSEESFYNAYANAVIAATASKTEDIISLVKKYISSFGPKITLADAASTMEFSVGIDFKDRKYSYDEILDLPEKIAVERGKRMIVCIDEFQHIGNYDDPLAFQAKLRSHWQTHQHVCYCLYGSKRHMLLDIFTDYEKPFYKFGDVIPLGKIDRDTWAAFIVKRFCDTGKSISFDLALQIADAVECHSYYVQQFSQMVWLLTDAETDQTVVDIAMRQLIDRSSLLFSNIIDGLKTRQLMFLLAIARGEKNFSSAQVLKRYNLGTSANIKNLRNAVLDRDLITVEPGTGAMDVQDPVLKRWLLMTY